MDSESDNESLDFLSVITPPQNFFDDDSSNTGSSIMGYGTDSAITTSEEAFNCSNEDYMWRQFYFPFGVDVTPTNDDDNENKRLFPAFKCLKIATVLLLLYFGYKKIKKEGMSFKWLDMFGFVSRWRKLNGF
ncbi:uncharacterized protein LOC119687413 [Teleopsis dalmanni]|uniref:uncharacterized protein LOC119687413 n=1 Tax=Teleopsis dalmanni TaxID=139649 RepID=UPI0018CCC43C|nr:uncharacterized protein LOC119687413 [Teleopsis dalmanni]